MTGVDLHLQDTIGCTFIGILFSTILHGLTLAQTTFYFTRYSADAISLKALVVILLILDTAKEMIIVQLLWNYLVESHRVPEALAILPSTYGAQHVLAAVAVLLVQCFYLKNIWHISPGNKCRTLLAALGTLLALVSFGAGMGLVWGMYQTRFFKQALALVTRAGFTQLGSALITDIYIASSLIVILHGSRTGFRPTDTLLSKLILYAVDRGILLCTVQIVQLVTYVHDYKNGTVTTEIAYFPQSTRKNSRYELLVLTTTVFI